MKTVTAEWMRELDRKAIEERGIASDTLMERAGEGVAGIVRKLALLSGDDSCPITLVAGKGNNGGDALVAARHLHAGGAPVRVLLAASPSALSEDATRNYQRLQEAGIPVQAFSTEEGWDLLEPESDRGLVVDGVFGTGFRGTPRDAAAGAIRYINRLSAGHRVVSIDLPSGLDADHGTAAGEAVCADVTVTLAFPKIGMTEPAALPFIGSVFVVDIGIPGDLSVGFSSDRELITGEDVRAQLGSLSRTSHKGDHGHALIVAGAAGYAGAAAMAAAAALRAGAGRVSALVPRGVVPTVASVVPEAMVHGGAETPNGALAGNALQQWGHALKDFDVVLVGPGMTVQPSTRQILDHLLLGGCRALVLDADALNVVRGQPDVLRRSTIPVAVTPHPGEMGRLIRCTAKEVQQDRFAAALRLVEAGRCTVVLKGAGTIVAERGQPFWVNLTGNPGMARGGMGDVLSGMVCGFAAGGSSLAGAARVAVYLHGLAADRLAWRTSQFGMRAMDVVRELPFAFRDAMAV